MRSVWRYVQCSDRDTGLVNERMRRGVTAKVSVPNASAEQRQLRITSDFVVWSASVPGVVIRLRDGPAHSWASIQGRMAGQGER